MVCKRSRRSASFRPGRSSRNPTRSTCSRPAPEPRAQSPGRFLPGIRRRGTSVVSRRSRFQNILFVGRRNDARTQMAEAFAKTLLEPLAVVVRSAGLTPTRVSPWAVRVMAEVGIDITSQRSKALDTIVASSVDKLVLLESGLTLPPRFHGIRRVKWRVDDPDSVPFSSDAILRNFRKTRDDIEVFVLRLIASRATNSLPSPP
jgi:arsenate reductase